MHLLAAYWNWAGSNIGAMPACALIAGVFAAVFRKPLSRWWHRHSGMQGELAEIREMAAAAHRITADLFERHAGHPHPDAPGSQAAPE